MLKVVVVFLVLVLSSVVTAGLWSAKANTDNKPDEAERGEEVIVKEGHRVVTVEYDPQTDFNTKVLISPHDDIHVSNQAKETLSSVIDIAKEMAKKTLDEAKERAKMTLDEAKERAKMTLDEAKERAKKTLDEAKEKAKETLDEAKQKAREAATVLPNVGQGLSGPTKPIIHGPPELICEAFGKCTHTIATTLSKVKEKASETVHEVSEKAQEIEENAKEKVSEAIGKTKETLSRKTDEIASRAHEVAENVSSKIEEARERRGREMGEIFKLWGYIVSPRLVGSVMGVVHLLGFATACGMCVWVTFISSYVLAEALPRQQFGVVQSKVYPIYFRVLGFSVMLALVGHLHGQRNNLFSKSVGMAHAYSLLCCFAMILFSLLYLEPRATKAMFQRMKLEKEEGRSHGDDSYVSEPTARVTGHHVSAPSSTPVKTPWITPTPPLSLEKPDADTMSQIVKLGERLKKLNSYSSFLNILTLMALTLHLVYLGQSLHVIC